MSIKRFLSFVIFLQSMMVFGQRDFRPGYVINQNNDTLFGEIDYRGELLMGSVCGFRQENTKDVDFFPADIKGYRLIDSKYYISHTVNRKLVFLEVLIYGKLNIY